MTSDEPTDAESETSDGVTYRGAPGEMVVSDPVRIRALAHPVRLELLDFLDDAGSATATECAAAISESVASCSYHLRMLAKHGYIEQVVKPGREKPWKVVAHSRSTVIDREAPGSIHAVSAMATLSAERQFDRILSWLQRAPQLPIEDIDLSTLASSRFYATREEIAEFRDDMLHLVRRFEGRWHSPADRPDGSVPVQLFTVMNIDPDAPPASSDTETSPE